MWNFRVVFLYEQEHTGRFSNLHECTFNRNLKRNFVSFLNTAMTYLTLNIIAIFKKNSYSILVKSLQFKILQQATFVNRFTTKQHFYSFWGEYWHLKKLHPLFPRKSSGTLIKHINLFVFRRLNYGFKLNLQPCCKLWVLRCAGLNLNTLSVKKNPVSIDKFFTSE